MDIKNTDIRIGNWVLIPGGDDEIIIPCVEKQVDGSEGFGYRLMFGTLPHREPIICHLKHVAPIELKAKHLAGSGFELQPWGYVKGDFLMTVNFVFRAGNGLNKKIHYVHELQNLYYSLTGEELILNCGN